jgi:hypothetical protein
MRTRKMRLMIEFEAPCGAEFSDIREFIVEWLESGGGNRDPHDPLFHSLGDVRVSKPIVAWRDPAKKEKPKLKVVDLKTSPWMKKEL